MPRASLDGEVNVFNSDVVLGTRKWKSVLLTGRYRIYHYANETPQLPLPGYVAFGDGFWRSAIGPIPFDEFHEPNSYTRQRTSVEVVWKPVKHFQWKIEPNWVVWNREHRQVNRLNEYGLNTQVIYKPVKWFEARPHYRYDNRKPQVYDIGPLEFNGVTSPVPPPVVTGIHMFDQSQRIRNDAGIVLNVMDKAGWTVSGTYRYLSDAYDERFFGLGRFLQDVAGVDVNYAPSERWGFVAYYNHDNIRYRYRSIAKGAGANTWVPDNEWDRNTGDKVDTFGIGFNVSAAEQKFNLDTSYGFSFARQNFLTVNPNTVQAGAANDATAQPWSDVESRFHELRFDASYRFRRNITGGIRYLFEPYRLDDFALDNGAGIMQPYVFGSEAPENDARRFLFLDSRYNDTNAHMVGVYIRYSF